VIVWIWAASGPGDFCGVTDDPERARDAAAGCISSGEASAARVESARARLGTGWLTEGYVRSGHGWTATAAGGGTVVWKPVRAARGGVVNRAEAARVRAALRVRYPGAAVSVTRTSGGARVEVSRGRDRLTAHIADASSSPLLRLMFARPPRGRGRG
jgi:hypothetical protein